jgi:hypothetical protein
MHSTQNDKQNYFSQLATELIANILQYVPDQDLRQNVQFLSKDLYEITNTFFVDSAYTRAKLFLKWQKQQIDALKIDINKLKSRHEVSYLHHPHYSLGQNIMFAARVIIPVAIALLFTINQGENVYTYHTKDFRLRFRSIEDKNLPYYILLKFLMSAVAILGIISFIAMAAVTVNNRRRMIPVLNARRHHAAIPRNLALDIQALVDKYDSLLNNTELSLFNNQANTIGLAFDTLASTLQEIDDLSKQLEHYLNSMRFIPRATVDPVSLQRIANSSLRTYSKSMLSFWSHHHPDKKLIDEIEDSMAPTKQQIHS